MKNISFIRRHPVELVVGLSAFGLFLIPLALGWGNHNSESQETAIDLSRPNSHVDLDHRDTSVVMASSNSDAGQNATAPAVDALSPDEFASGVENELTETIVDDIDPWASVDELEEEIVERFKNEQHTDPSSSTVSTQSEAAEPSDETVNRLQSTESKPEDPESSIANEDQLTQNFTNWSESVDSNDFQVRIDSSNATQRVRDTETDFTWNPESLTINSSAASDMAVLSSDWKTRIQQPMIEGRQRHPIDLDTAVIEALESSTDVRIARANQSAQLESNSYRDRFRFSWASLKRRLPLLSKTSSTQVVISDTNFIKNELRKRQQIQAHIVSVVDAYWMLYQARANLAIELANSERAAKMSRQMKSASQGSNLGNQLVRIEAVSATRESNLVKARYSLLNAQENLISLVSGLDSTPENIELIPQDEPMEYQLAYDIKTAENLAIRYRPEVQKAAAMLQADAGSRPLTQDLKMEKAIGDVMHDARLAFRNAEGIQQEVNSNRRAVAKAAAELKHVESLFSSASSDGLTHNLALEDVLTTQQRLAWAQRRLINSLARVSVAQVLLKKATGELLENESLVGDQPASQSQPAKEAEPKSIPANQFDPTPKRSTPSPPRTASRSHELKTGFKR